ncbi:MAG: hypothetical protein ACFFED_08565 [Candidatus Thorarchaeota archaeon]
MYHEYEQKERNVSFAVSVNIARIVVYTLVTLAYLQDFFNEGMPYNILNFLVPSVLAIMDFLLLILCVSNERRFWNILPTISIIAMIISFNTALTYFRTGQGVTFLGDVIYPLALFVFVISALEFINWAAEEAGIMKSMPSGSRKKTRDHRTWIV